MTKTSLDSERGGVREEESKSCAFSGAHVFNVAVGGYCCADHRVAEAVARLRNYRDAGSNLCSADSKADRAGHSNENQHAADVVPPKKRRKKDTLYSKTDSKAWGYSDEEVIASARSQWRSDAYDHYTIGINRTTNSSGTKIMTYIFKCKHGSPEHATQERERAKTSSGTTNLKNTAALCDAQRGVVA
ncbi:hypothetical protein B0H13DRAFT_1907018 [Mycena leptocephala]|nr:hypothetical protein B0H13DRAFT_1907018 [Mycena leptocephala]